MSLSEVVVNVAAPAPDEPDENDLRESLLHSLGLPDAAVAEYLGRVDQVVDEPLEHFEALKRAKLAQPDGKNVRPLGFAIHSYLASEINRIDELRAQSLRLSAPVTTGHTVASCEVINGHEETLRRVHEVYEGSIRDLRVLDLPPRLPAGGVLQSPHLTNGGPRTRVLYNAEQSSADELAYLRRLWTADTEVRAASFLPMGMVLADDHLGIVVFSSAGTTSDPATRFAGCVIVYPSRLLIALAGVFAEFWSHSYEIGDTNRFGIGPGFDPTDERILSLLAGGALDHDIARSVGVSPRTLSRRLAAMQAALNAPTRFVLGMRAADLLRRDRRPNPSS